MPKLIDNLKEKYIEIGKEILMSKGYRALTLRMVAERCGVALGTLYNYFRSKDELVAYIMFEDWTRLLVETGKKCRRAASKEKGIKEVYMMIREFSSIYSFVWSESSHGAISYERHMMLVNQTSELILEVLKNDDEDLARFIAEILITYGTREKDEYKTIEKNIVKLIR